MHSNYKTTRLQGFKTSRLQDFKTTRLQDYKTTRLQDFKTTRLQDFKTSRLQDFKNTRLQDYKNTRLIYKKGKPILNISLDLKSSLNLHPFCRLHRIKTHRLWFEEKTYWALLVWLSKLGKLRRTRLFYEFNKVCLLLGTFWRPMEDPSETHRRPIGDQHAC